MRGLTIQGGYHKYKEIAFLRGFAITTVVLMHLFQVYWNEGHIPDWLRFATALGGTGGHVFIFCSGFGLYLSYLHRPLRFTEFMKKRFLKIYIPYVLFLLIHMILPHWDAENAIRFRQLLSHLFLYKMFFERYMCSFGLQMWFISTIIQLYLLFIPICRLRKRIPMKTLMLLSLMLSLGWWIAMYLTGLERWRIWSSFCLQYLWEFVLGMGVAELLFQRERVNIPLWMMVLTVILGLGLQALMARCGGLAAALNDVPGLLGYTGLVMLLYNFGGRVLQRVFLGINTISYEWFLVHVDAIMWSYHYMRIWTETEWIRAAGALSFSLLTAWVFSKLVHAVMILMHAEKAGAGRVEA